MSQQAEDAKARGLEEQVSAARKNKQLLGQQRAMMAAKRNVISTILGGSSNLLFNSANAFKGINSGNINDVTGTAYSGGNVRFTNGSYKF